jgi:hypothetical protein
MSAEKGGKYSKTQQLHLPDDISSRTPHIVVAIFGWLCCDEPDS